MEFRILGSMEVWDNTRSLALPAGRGRALLAMLAVHRREVVSAGRLIDELWGEHPPATANTVIQRFVSRLRKELDRFPRFSDALETLARCSPPRARVAHSSASRPKALPGVLGCPPLAAG